MRKFIHLGLIGLMVISVVHVAAAHGDGLSAACQEVSGTTGAGAGTGLLNVFSGEFSAGEEISFSVTTAGDEEATIAIYSPAGSFAAVAGPRVIQGHGSVRYIIPETGEYEFELSVETFDGVEFTYGVGCGEAADASAGPPCGNLFDGRINNNQQLDCAAPIAIYDQGLVIFAINPTTGAGTLNIQLSPLAFLTAYNPAFGNVLIAQTANPFTGQLVSVYWLTTNEIQVNTAYADGKAYVVAWPVGEPGELYHIAD
jgi:hypothetical protein